jgi:hypothetical protein
VIDAKRNFVRSLLIAQHSFAAANTDIEVGYFTYFTPSGLVCGKKVDVYPLNSESQDALTQDLVGKLENGEKVNLYQVAYSVLDLMTKDIRGDKYEASELDTKSIVLEDVIFRANDNSISKFESFVLFTDQITGIVPGKLDI